MSAALATTKVLTRALCAYKPTEKVKMCGTGGVKKCWTGGVKEYGAGPDE